MCRFPTGVNRPSTESESDMYAWYEIAIGLALVLLWAYKFDFRVQVKRMLAARKHLLAPVSKWWLKATVNIAWAILCASMFLGVCLVFTLPHNLLYYGGVWGVVTLLAIIAFFVLATLGIDAIGRSVKSKK